MANFLLTYLPISLLFLGVALFSGLIYKLTTQNVKPKKRSKQFLLQQFTLCLVLFMIFFPMAIGVAAGDDFIASVFIRCIPIVLSLSCLLGCWTAFMSVIRFYPKDEAAPKTEIQTGGEEAPN